MRMITWQRGFRLKDVDRAYLAGLFDGEGCASVSYSKELKTIKTGEKLFPNFRVQFIISNEDNRVLKETRLLFGKGGIYPKDGSFRISKPRDVIEAIELIRPHVKVKKTDLDNLYKASEFILEVRGSRKRHRWTEEEKNEFVKFEETSKALKGPRKRGGKSRKYP